MEERQGAAKFFDIEEERVKYEMIDGADQNLQKINHFSLLCCKLLLIPVCIYIEGGMLSMKCFFFGCSCPVISRDMYM